MKKTLLILFVFCATSLGYSQVSAKQNTSSSSTVSAPSISFETYCLDHAMVMIDGKSTSKTAIPFKGELKAVLKPNPTYLDYGIVLQEAEAQYFTVEGSDRIVKVESLFRLRLMYDHSSTNK